MNLVNQFKVMKIRKLIDKSILNHVDMLTTLQQMKTVLDRQYVTDDDLNQIKKMFEHLQKVRSNG